MPWKWRMSGGSPMTQENSQIPWLIGSLLVLTYSWETYQLMRWDRVVFHGSMHPAVPCRFFPHEIWGSTWLNPPCGALDLTSPWISSNSPRSTHTAAWISALLARGHRGNQLGFSYFHAETIQWKLKSDEVLTILIEHEPVSNLEMRIVWVILFVIARGSFIWENQFKGLLFFVTYLPKTKLGTGYRLNIWSLTGFCRRINIGLVGLHGLAFCDPDGNIDQKTKHHESIILPGIG